MSKSDALFKKEKEVAEKIERLIQALKSEESDVRKYAAESLGAIGDPRAVNPLIQALKDENWKVRREAVWALERKQHGLLER